MKEKLMALQSTESQLAGTWQRAGDGLQLDDVSRRIERLTREALEPMSLSGDGWSALYRDPIDGRLWERTYPARDARGEGPPHLQTISQEKATAKYPGLWDGVAVTRQDVARRAEQYLADRISFDDFFAAMPEVVEDDDVAELRSLIEHEPQKGGLLGVRAAEHERYMAEIRNLVTRLLQRRSPLSSQSGS